MREETPRRRLSFGARGLLDELAALDSDVDRLDPAELARLSPRNGRDSVRGLLDELEANGFLRRWRTAPNRDARGQVRGAPVRRWRVYSDGDAVKD